MKYEIKMSQEKKKLLYHDQQYLIQDLSYFIQYFIHCPPSPEIIYLPVVDQTLINT